MAIQVSSAGWYTRAAFFSAGDAITMMAWAFPTTLPTSTHYNNLVASNVKLGINIHNPAGTSFWSMGTSLNDFDGTTAVSANTWYHVACTRNGNPKELFLNGVSEKTGTDADTLGTGLVIGDVDGAESADEWQGRMAAVKIWKAVLTVAEIQAEMRQYLPARTANLVGFWPMHSLSDDEIDFSGNAATLTVGGSGHAIADGPPIPWKQGRRRLIYVPTVGGGATKGPPPFGRFYRPQFYSRRRAA